MLQSRSLIRAKRVLTNQPQTPTNLRSTPKKRSVLRLLGGLCPFFDGNGAERSSNLLKTSPIMQTRLRGSTREPPPRSLGWATQGIRGPRTASCCDERPAQGTDHYKGF